MSSKFYCSWSPLGKAAFNIAVAGLVGFVFFFFLKKNYFFFNLYEYGVYCLTELIANSVKFVLHLFGFNCLTFGKIISNTDGVSLILDRGCVGRNVLVVFAAFIIATPAEVWRKFAYIAAGLAVIVLLNVLRISLLMYVGTYHNEWFHFAHEYLFKYTLYAGVFLLWVLWMNKFRSSSSFSSPQEKAHC